MMTCFNPYAAYKPQPIQKPEEIHADILAPEKETEGLLGEIVGVEKTTIVTARANLIHNLVHRE